MAWYALLQPWSAKGRFFREMLRFAQHDSYLGRDSLFGKVQRRLSSSSDPRPERFWTDRAQPSRSVVAIR